MLLAIVGDVGNLVMTTLVVIALDHVVMVWGVVMIVLVLVMAMMVLMFMVVMAMIVMVDWWLWNQWRHWIWSDAWWWADDSKLGDTKCNCSLRPDPPDSWSLPPSSSSRGFLKYNYILIYIQDYHSNEFNMFRMLAVFDYLGNKSLSPKVCFFAYFLLTTFLHSVI